MAFKVNKRIRRVLFVFGALLYLFIFFEGSVHLLNSRLRSLDNNEEQSILDVSIAGMRKGFGEYNQDLSHKMVKNQERGKKRLKKGKQRAAMVIAILHRYEYLKLLSTIENYQRRFNDRYNYDWVIITYRLLPDDIRDNVASVVGTEGAVKFVELKYRAQFLDFPKDTDRKRLSKVRRQTRLPAKLRNKNTYQGRHFTRFLLGHFFNMDHLWRDYDFVWRVPVGSSLECDVDYDVFEYMISNGIKYGWLLMQEEYPHLHPSLIGDVKTYITDPKNNFLEKKSGFLNNAQFLLEDMENPERLRDSEYAWKMRQCSFFSEFELMDISFFKSKQYQHFFNYLDKQNGIYYETWREPVIKTIATCLFLDNSEVHFFDDLAVAMPSQELANCPINSQFFTLHKCSCNPVTLAESLKGDNLQYMYNSPCVHDWLQKSNAEIPQSLNQLDPFFFKEYID